MLPASAGHELIRRLLPTRPSMKVLYLSGYAQDTLPASLAAEGQKAFLPETFTLQSLAVKVREVLGPPQLTAAATTSNLRHSRDLYWENYVWKDLSFREDDDMTCYVMCLVPIFVLLVGTRRVVLKSGRRSSWYIDRSRRFADPKRWCSSPTVYSVVRPRRRPSGV